MSIFKLLKKRSQGAFSASRRQEEMWGEGDFCINEKLKKGEGLGFDN